MTEVKFEADEWYPVYSIIKNDRDLQFAEGSLFLTEEELKDFKETFAKFEQWQDRIRKHIRTEI